MHTKEERLVIKANKLNKLAEKLKTKSEKLQAKAEKLNYIQNKLESIEEPNESSKKSSMKSNQAKIAIYLAVGIISFPPMLYMNTTSKASMRLDVMVEEAVEEEIKYEDEDEVKEIRQTASYIIPQSSLADQPLLEINLVEKPVDKKVEPLVITEVSQQDALLEIENPDENYVGVSIKLEDDDRNLLEHLVMGEAGGSDMIAASLVAQAIRDAIVTKGYNSVSEVRSALSYSGSIKKEPTENVINACKFIFDEGGVAVKHNILYFYAPDRVNSSWHESQTFIVEYGGHRYFAPNT